MAAANEASQIARSSADHALDARAAFQRGLCHLSKCEFALAVSNMQETYSVIGDASHRDTYGLDPALGVVALSYQGRALAELGEFAEATRVMVEARRLAESIDKPFSYIFSFLGEGYVADRFGDFDLAIRSFEVGLEKSNAAEAPLMYVPAATFLGMAYSHAGRSEEAVALLGKAVEVADSMEFMCQQPLRLGYLAEGLIAVGQVALAKATVERAFSMAISQCERGAEAFAEYLRASILAKLEPTKVEEARHHYDRAVELATELSMLPLLARIQFTYGEFLATAGIDDIAAQKLTISMDLFQSMGMTNQITATTRLLRRIAAVN